MVHILTGVQTSSSALHRIEQGESSPRPNLRAALAEVMAMSELDSGIAHIRALLDRPADTADPDGQQECAT